jgi:SAM-dependent methyltransferase
MKPSTVSYLNALNRTFYQIAGDDFDATRGEAWRGWYPVRDMLTTPLKVLDVGCGNGRLGVFLAKSLEGQIQYQGMDSSPLLLARAQSALSTFTHVTAQLEEQDVVENPPDSSEYDLVALFGVLHHVPSLERRIALVKACAGRVKTGGLLAFACWRFYEYERFRSRIVPFPSDIQADVEAGDYLLDWRRGVNALRYCHYADDVETALLVESGGLCEISAYRADGFSGDVNAYRILQKK